MLFVEGLPKKKAGENEKHLHRHRRPRRDGQAAVKKGDDVAEQELDEIQPIASLLLHGLKLPENFYDLGLVVPLEVLAAAGGADVALCPPLRGRVFPDVIAESPMVEGDAAAVVVFYVSKGHIFLAHIVLDGSQTHGKGPPQVRFLHYTLAAPKRQRLFCLCESTEPPQVLALQHPRQIQAAEKHRNKGGTGKDWFRDLAAEPDRSDGAGQSP